MAMTKKKAPAKTTKAVAKAMPVKSVKSKTILAKNVITPEQRKGNLIYVDGNCNLVAKPFNRKGRKKGSYSAKKCE